MDTRDKKRPAQQKARPAGHRAGSGTRTKTAASRTGVATKPQTRRRNTSPKPTPDVVYTQPGPFNKSRFLLQLLTVIAVVLALLFGMSIFFKVKTVTVAGANKYTAWDIREASGIQEGENLLTLSEARLSSNIRSKLPYVDEVRVGIKLPDTVKIEIKELDVVYAIETDDGSWWLMRADGGIVEQINGADAELHTKVLGVRLSAPKVGEKAKAAQPVSGETTESGEPVPAIVDAAQQLDTAVSILQFLEDRSILGDVISVDVSDLDNLEMWYTDRFQVLLGDTTQLSYKIGLIKTAVDEYMQTYDSGVLDASFTIQPDSEKEYQVIYTPFDGN